MTEFDVVATPAGPCTVVVKSGRLLRLSLGKRPASGARRVRLGRARKWLSGFFAGGAPRVPLDLSFATPFERNVYRVVERIPAGRTKTYGEVARAAGHPGAARAVGGAMAKNRICLFGP